MRPKSNSSTSFFNTNIVRHYLPKSSPLLLFDKYIDWESFRSILMKNAEEQPIQYSSIGRTAWDVIIIYKTMFCQYYYNLSDRKIEERAFTDLAIREFLGISFPERIPDDTTLVRYRNLWGEGKIKKINEQVIHQAQTLGYAKITQGIVSDTTHQYASIQRLTGRELLLQAIRKVLAELLIVPESYLPTGNTTLPAELLTSFEVWSHEEQMLIQTEQLTKTERFKRVAEYAITVVDTLHLLLNSLSASLIETLEWKSVAVFVNFLDQILMENVSSENCSLVQIKGKRKIISLVDPEVRTGHKTRQKPFIGTKASTARTFDGFTIEVDTLDGSIPDSPQAPIIINEVISDYHEVPDVGSFDKGYDSIENRLQMLAKGVQPGIQFKKSQNPRHKDLFSADQFYFDFKTFTVTCPKNQKTTSYNLTSNQKNYRFVFPKTTCTVCPLKSKCTVNKNGRTVQFSIYQELVEDNRVFLQTETYETSRKARWGQEADYGYGKRCFDLGKTRYRGLKKISFQNRMIFLVRNITRLA